MLSQQSRLRTSADFQSVMKFGRKIHRSSIVLHAKEADYPRLGVIVGKSFGPAVQRNRAKRILRHTAGELMGQPPSLEVVVRAVRQGGNLRAEMISAWNQIAREIAS
jgi:ribonuclease P protein component